MFSQELAPGMTTCTGCKICALFTHLSADVWPWCHVLCRGVVSRAIILVHAAFHALYTVLATVAREWCLQQNIDRMQVNL
jgi:hypothetical protein